MPARFSECDMHLAVGGRTVRTLYSFSDQDVTVKNHEPQLQQKGCQILLPGLYETERHRLKKLARDSDSAYQWQIQDFSKGVPFWFIVGSIFIFLICYYLF